MLERGAEHRGHLGIGYSVSVGMVVGHASLIRTPLAYAFPIPFFLMEVNSLACQFQSYSETLLAF